MESIDEGALNGDVVMRHRQIFKEKFGAATVDQALEDLPLEEREAIVSARPQGWVPVSAVQRLYEALAARVDRDPAELHWEIAHDISERNLKTIWRLILRLTSDAQLMAQAPIVYRRTWNRGMLSVRKTHPRRATVHITGWPGIPEFTVRGVGVALERSLSLSGRRNVRIDAERQPDGVTYALRWDP